MYGFSDSDYAGDCENRKRTSGYVFKLSSGAVSCNNKIKIKIILFYFKQISI